jgi:hypothetical protein
MEQDSGGTTPERRIVASVWSREELYRQRSPASTRLA